jgi:AcrR family transcriptional regulator
VAREHILDVAHRLFYWDGIRATGIDTVAEKAGVAPTAIYRLFTSKDDLVSAYLDRAAVRYRAWFDSVTEAAPSAEAAVLALFDALAEQVQPNVCRGCPFVMALTEFPDANVEGHRTAVLLKEWVHGRLRQLVQKLASDRSRDVADVAALTDHLMLLFEGVYATVPAFGASGPARRARTLAGALVEGTLRRPPSRAKRSDPLGRRKPELHK